MFEKKMFSVQNWILSDKRLIRIKWRAVYAITITSQFKVCFVLLYFLFRVEFFLLAEIKKLLGKVLFPFLEFCLSKVKKGLNDPNSIRVEFQKAFKDLLIELGKFLFSLFNGILISWVDW